MNVDALADVVCCLKNVVRTGWIKRDVENPESVADHTYGLCLLVLLMCPDNLNKLKCFEFAVVHDLAEALTGDYTPEDTPAKEEKYRLEIEAIHKIAQKIGNSTLPQLFSEYEKQDTPEARFVKQMDKLEVVLQARYYDNNHRSSYWNKHKGAWKTLFEEFESNACKVLDENLQQFLKK